MYVILREIPKVSPRRPDTGALFAYRLIVEDQRRVVFADTVEDLARVVCRGFGYPTPGLAPVISTFELAAQSRRMFSIELAREAQAVVLASLEDEMPLGARKLSSLCREALFQDRGEVPRHPILVWPRRDVPLILVASSYSPVTAHTRTLGATWIDDLDDASLIDSATAIRGWRLDRSPQALPGEDAANVGGQERE